jgi:hypothetical protein
MKLVKSLLLGGAAGLVAVSGASAADLAVTKPAPAEYVRICSSEGSGFFFIPGTETCLKISGRVRVDLRFDDAAVDGDFGWDIRTTGRVGFDARTATSLGTLRSNLVIDFPGGTFDRAFIQLGGFVVGLADQLYGFDDVEGVGSRSDGVNMIGYNFTTGSGFYAGIAVYDNFVQVGGNPFTDDVGGMLAIGYDANDVHVRLSGFADTENNFGVMLQGEVGFGSGTTIFASALFEDYGNGAFNPNFGADGTVFGGALRLTQSFSDSLRGQVAVAYESFDADAAGGDDELLLITANIRYTVVPGFFIEPAVFYRTDLDDNDSVTGRIRFQREW